ncbi:MAG: alcohol dehydrogenase catalytic domain-containing protein [Candidatus Tectomicrobia bacterium]|nr:alcohol dehydrogenase catalytic domain-containing protein [Candidatus Tectomicrobia bacterium]
MKRALLYGPRDLRVAEGDIPTPKPNEVLIKVITSSICATDAHIYEGTFKFPYPSIQGHDFTGVIEAVGAEVRSLAVGDRVTMDPISFCLHCRYCRAGRYNICETSTYMGMEVEGCFQDYLTLPQHRVFRLPEQVDEEEAAVMEPLHVALNTMRKLGYKVGETVVVLGQGPMGLCQGQVAKMVGCRVIVVDVLPKRLKLAESYGVDFALNAAELEVNKEIATICGGDGPHCVIDTAGTEKTNRQTVRIAANGGKIAIIAGHFAVPVPFMIGKELQVFGIRGGGPENVELAIRLLQEKRIDLRSTITTHFDFKDIGEAFRQFYENKENVVKIMLRN